MKKPLVIVGGVLLAIGLVLGVLGIGEYSTANGNYDNADYNYSRYEDAYTQGDTTNAERYLSFALDDLSMGDEHHGTAMIEGIVGALLIVGGGVALFLGLKGKKGKMALPTA